MPRTIHGVGVCRTPESTAVYPSPRPQGRRVRASLRQAALDVQRHEPRRRPRRKARVRGQAVRCGCSPPEAAPCVRGGRPPSDLPRPATPIRPKARVSGPPAASPYPILHGMSRRLCAALRLVARCGGGVPKVVRDPYARSRRPPQPLRRLPRVTRAGGGALVSGKGAPSPVAVRQWGLTHHWWRVFRSAGGTATAPGSPPPPTTRRRGIPAPREGEPQYTPKIEQKP